MFQSTNSQESSENEEVYLLSDEDQDDEPSEEQILNYIVFLGFEVTQDDDLKEIAKKALLKELPIGWKRAFLKNSNRMCYFDTVTQNFHQYTPSDEKAIKEYDALKKSKQNITVGKGKNIQPLAGESQGKNKKVHLNPIKESKINQGKDTEKYSNNVLSDSVIQDDIEIESKKSKGKKKELDNDLINNKEESKKDYNAFNKSYSNKNKYSELNQSYSSSKEKEGKRNENVEKKFDSNSKLEKDIEKNNDIKHINNEIAQLDNNNKEPNISKSKLSSSQNMVDNSAKKPGTLKKVDNTFDKKRYYEDKLKELKKFEEDEQEKYESKKKIYKEKKTSLKQNYQTKCEEELISEFYKLEKLHNGEEFTRKIETDFLNEIDQYKELLQNKKNRELSKENQIHDNKISSLKEESRQTLVEIFQLSKQENENNLISFESNPDIQETKQLLEEKFAIEVKSLEMNFESMLKQIEFEEESYFRNEISQIKLSLKQSNENKEKSFKTYYVKILEDYRDALDADYAIQCKNFQKDLEINFDKEIELQSKEFDTQIEENSKLMKESIKEVEKDYSDEICKIRINGKAESSNRNKIINDNFDVIAQMYNMIKLGMNEKLEEVGGSLLEKLNSFSKGSEENLEEFLLRTYDISNIETQKKKNKYELIELEYKTKSILLEYFLEVGGELIAFVTEQNFMFNDHYQNEGLFDHFFKVVKARQQKYKQKLIKWRENKLFNFVDMIKPPIRVKQNNPFKMSNSTDKVPSIKNSLELGNTNSQFTFVKRNIDNKRYIDTSNMYDFQGSQNAMSISTSKMNQLLSSIGNKDNDIINNLNTINKETIAKINSFIEDEKSAFQKEELDISNDKVIHENFKDALRKSNFGYKTSLNESSIISNNKAINYIEIMNEDDLKIKRNSEKLERRKTMYDRIVETYSDLYQFVQENAKDPDDSSVNCAINEKLSKVLFGIDEYNDIFYQNYQRKAMNSSLNENLNNLSLSKEIPQKLNKSINIKDTSNNLNKSYLDKYYNSINEKQSSNSFNNFVQFYGRNSIHKELRNTSSTQYFNFRKNKSNLNHKSEYLNFSFS